MRELPFADREVQFHTKRIFNPTMNQLIHLTGNLDDVVTLLTVGEKRLNDGTLLRLHKPRSDLCLEVITSEEKSDVSND